MPCSDGGQTAEDNRIELKKLLAEVDIVTGVACALLRTAYNNGFVEELITNAEKEGKAPVRSFWKKHQRDDRKRLIADLSKYSADERAVLKELLNKHH